jgi:hypothetical protein
VNRPACVQKNPKSQVELKLNQMTSIDFISAALIRGLLTT